jgi:hypothetical protein
VWRRCQHENLPAPWKLPAGGGAPAAAVLAIYGDLASCWNTPTCDAPPPYPPDPPACVTRGHDAEGMRIHRLLPVLNDTTGGIGHRSTPVTGQQAAAVCLRVQRLPPVGLQRPRAAGGGRTSALPLGLGQASSCRAQWIRRGCVLVVYFGGFVVMGDWRRWCRRCGRQYCSTGVQEWTPRWWLCCTSAHQ